MGPANTGGIFKEVHHDIWAYDARSPVALFDTQINGQARKALYEAGNTGWRYLLNRTDGQLLLGIDERPVAQDTRQRRHQLSACRTML